MFEDAVAFLADIGNAWRRIVIGKRGRNDKWVYLQWNAFFIESVGDDLRDQFLFELSNVKESNSDAGVFESIDRFARER